MTGIWLFSPTPDHQRSDHTSLTEEAVDDSKEAAHGADHRRHYLIFPLNLLVTLQSQLGQTKQLAGGRHAGVQ